VDERSPDVSIVAALPRRWWLGLCALALATACAASSRSSRDPSADDEPKLTHTEPAPSDEHPTPTPETEPPEPAPLAELDAEAVAAAAPPEPDPEPLPFDEEQLARIYAVQDIVAAASAAHGVEPELINALIWVESKFERRARGPAGAQGLMQLMPRTAGAMAKRLDRKRRSYDPDFNIHAGTLLLSRLLERFDGDVRLALAGYNRGGGTVSKWIAAGEPLPEGVEKFVERVLRAKAWFDRLPPEPAPASEAAPETEAEPKSEPQAKPPSPVSYRAGASASESPTG
jgi:soluble lytic murein transglycosylase-like protein